jgi:hypothetical protein
MSNPEPVGLNCPGCGELPVMVFGGTQAWCGNGDCAILTWDPTKTAAELAADTKVIDLRGEGGPAS